MIRKFQSTSLHCCEVAAKVIYFSQITVIAMEDMNLIDGLLIFSPSIGIQYDQSFEKGDDGIRLSLSLRL